MPRVSIITPTYNAFKYITGCIENVAAQKVDGLEHLVVDGGSHDGTVDELRRLAQVHPHLKFVSEPDKGQSDAMNKGVALASAAIIGFLNADDFYEFGAINAALPYLDNDASLAMIVGACRVLNEDGATEFWNKPYNLRPEALMLGWRYFQFPCNPSAYSIVSLSTTRFTMMSTTITRWISTSLWRWRWSIRCGSLTGIGATSA